VQVSVAGEVFRAVVFFLPAYIANMTPCYLARFGFFKALAYPLDGGRAWSDGRRVLGDGKTLAGIAYGTAIGTAVALAQGGSWAFGAVASLGALAGDVASSFLKRRVGVERGGRVLLLDQLNFVVGGLALLALSGMAPPARTMLILVLVTPPLHLLMNLVGHRLGFKEVPW
jgi:CDP-2,3-bis-(O-geranylgeranyl)-sn-glycerol synthase